jgi:hypothetical protein
LRSFSSFGLGLSLLALFTAQLCDFLSLGRLISFLGFQDSFGVRHLETCQRNSRGAIVQRGCNTGADWTSTGVKVEILGYGNRSTTRELRENLLENYSAQAVRVPFINDNLTGLRSELDKATLAIRGATEQAKESSQSAAKLARSLNLITACLVAVGIIQTFVLLWHR